MVEKRKKWRAITIAIFVLAVVMAFSNRFLPKPVLETEAVVEQYLLTRTLFMLAAGVMAFVGLLTMFNKLRCPHCGAFGLKQIQICTNCGNIHVGKKAPEMCPVCQHPKAYFQKKVSKF